MFKIIFLFFLLFTSLYAKELEKVSIQLQWLDQFQFAGYYVAKEKGFYSDAGLDVEIKKFDYKMSVLDEVTQGRATYGVGRASLIIEKSKGVNIKLLASIFQSSPSILIALKDSNITNIEDFKGKSMMVTSDSASTVSYFAMENKFGISSGDIVLKEHTFNLNDLIENKVDLISSYISNEPFLLQERGIEYRIFDPKEYGFDFYSDILFTTNSEMQNYPSRARDFHHASMAGWRYAFENIEETVELILEKYNPQNKSKKALLFEARALKKLAFYKTNQLGKIDKQNIQSLVYEPAIPRRALFQ